MHKLLTQYTTSGKKIVFFLLFFICLAFHQGCAVLGGGSEINRAHGYNVAAPTDWKIGADQGESDHTYKLPSGNLVTVTSSCGHSKSRTLEIETKHLLMGARNINLKKRDTFTVNSFSELHSSVSASMDGKTFQLEICVLKKDNCVFDFVLLSPKEISAQENESFINFIKSIKSGTN